MSRHPLIGGWTVRHLCAAGHDVDVVIGGRRPAEAAAPAREWNASVVKLDTGHAEAGLAAAGPVDLVVSTVQDPDDNLLRAALRAGSAHLGIVRKADNVGRTMIIAADLAQRPAMIMGHWQAGVTTFAALATAREFGRVERIELAALFDLTDPTGPMTSDDSGAFFNRSLLRRDGHWETVEPASSIRTVDRGDPPAFDAQPMGSDRPRSAHRHRACPRPGRRRTAEGRRDPPRNGDRPGTRTGPPARVRRQHHHRPSPAGPSRIAD